MGVLRPLLLSSIISSLGAAQEPEQRVAAAEGIHWIPKTHRGIDWWNLNHRLAADVAEDVRDALRDATNRARKLDWAHGHTRRLLAPVKTKNSNIDVLSRWKYSQGLVHVGDDETALRIRHHLQNVKLPTSYQRFLIKTGETLEKNWDKCRRKWPEPMFSGQATSSNGEGTLLIKGQSHDVQFILWQNTSVADPTILNHGGTVVLPKPTKSTDLLGTNLKLILSDGSEREIWISGIENQRRLSFVGGEEALNLD